MRLFGSLICWVLPDRVLEEVGPSRAGWPDYLSTLVGTGIVYAALFKLVEATQKLPEGRFIPTLVGGMLGLGVVNVLLILGITWAFAVALRDNKGTMGIGFADLLSSHLHIHPVALTFAFVGFVTDSFLVVVLGVLALVRTLDLQARALQHIAGLSSWEAYKAASVLFAILLGTIALLAVIF